MVFQNFWKPYYNTPDSFDFTPLNPPASGGKHIRDVLLLISPVYGGIKGGHTKTVRTIDIKNRLIKKCLKFCQVQLLYDFRNNSTALFMSELRF